MVEQPDASKGHGDTVLVTDLYNIVVTYGAAGLGDEFYAGLVGALNVVAEGEEGIASKGYASHAVQPLAALFTCEGLGLLSEEVLPLSVSEHVHIVVGNIYIDGIIPVRPADVRLKGELEYLGGLTQIPVVRLISG